MEKKSYVLISLTVLFLCSLLVFVLNTQKSNPQSPLGVVNNYSEKSITMIKLTESGLIDGTSVDVRKTDVIQVQLNNQNHFFEVLDINPSKQYLQVLFDNSQEYKISFDKTEKINFDLDRYYDFKILLSSISDNKARLHITAIKEELSMVDLLDLKIKSSISASSNASTIQVISFVILVVILGVLIIYLILYKIAPWIMLRNQTEEENPEDIFGYMFSEFKEAIKKNKKSKAKRIASKIKKMYEYLPENQKKQYSKKLKEIESYIN